MPNTALSLPVTNGLFSVGLGDTTVQGAQSQIPPAIFANSDLRLRIWFSDGIVPPAVIADHAITSVGYALMAMTVPDGSITSAKIASGAVMSANIASAAVTSAQLADDIFLTNLRLAGTGFGNGTETVTLDAATGAGQGALFTLRNGGGTPTWTLDADTTLRGSLMTFFDAFGQATVSMDSSANHGGGSLALRTGNNAETVTFVASDGAGQGARLEMRQANSARTVVLDAQGNTGGGFMEFYKSDGTRTVWLDADASGEGKISTQVLEITGGADFSENFEVRSRDAQPGMIVRIDAEHPGELAVSDRAYDRSAAGVVSGAGGVKPGVMMGQRGTAADGRHPVALTGRVYCLVDADRGAIEPGDLITTSDTPGHGMKASDSGRAPGAIVGKAMTGLESGRGLVLVLVSLQ
jgi:hypothetical protein